MHSLLLLFKDARNSLGDAAIDQYVSAMASTLSVDVPASTDLVDRVHAVVDEFRSAAGNSVANFIRSVGVAYELEYKDILFAVAEKMDLTLPANLSEEVAETAIVAKHVGVVVAAVEGAKRQSLEQILGEKLKGAAGAKLDALLESQASSPGPVLSKDEIGALSSIALAAAGVGPAGTTAAVLLGAGLGSPLSLAIIAAKRAYSLSEPDYDNKIIPSIMLLANLRASIRG